MLRGEDLGEMDVTLTSGETDLTVPPYGFGEPLGYPIAWGRAWRHAGAWTIVVVNSSESPVTAQVSRLPRVRAEHLHDGVVEDVTDGVLVVDLGRLEARVYRGVEIDP